MEKRFTARYEVHIKSRYEDINASCKLEQENLRPILLLMLATKEKENRPIQD